MVIKIEAGKRTLGKKSDRKDLRKGFNIPGIMYGQGVEGTPIQFNAPDFMKAYKQSIGELAIFNIVVDGKEHRCILKAKQIHPVRRDIIHVDFLLLNPGHEVSLSLPIKFVGEAAGQKMGGIVDIIVRHLNIACLPKDIPEDVEVDISALEIGDSLHIKDVKVPNVKVKDAEDITIVVIHDKSKVVEKLEDVEEKGQEGSAE
ncbi:50S ribosomal protein L25 [bacterium]|nr:50S ribosomal protein L25 [bacterium]